MEDATARLLEAAGGGDRGALARLVTVIERGGPAAEAVSSALPGPPAGVHLVGVTGAPGAGKSTLIGRLLGVLAAAGRRPAVIAVDPSSSITGGAVLADRVRMDAGTDGAFVRSMATRGAHGGLAAAVPAAVRLLAGAGFDPVIVETTGVGQAEIAIASAVDTTVFVGAPGGGDALQANKAGLLELADVLVVNKADRPGAGDLHRDLTLMLDLGEHTGLIRRTGGRRPALLSCDAITGTGVPEIIAAIDDHRAHLTATGLLADRRRRRDLLEVSALVDAHLAALRDAALSSPAGREALHALRDGGVSPDEAARRMIAAIPAPGGSFSGGPGPAR